MKKLVYFVIILMCFVFIVSCQKSEKSRLEDFLNEVFLHFSDSAFINHLKNEFAERVMKINSIDNFDIKVKEIQDTINIIIENDFKRISQKNGFSDPAEYEKILENYKKDKYINLLNEKLKMLSKSNTKTIQQFSQKIIATKLKELTDKNYQNLMSSQQPSNNKDSNGVDK